MLQFLQRVPEFERKIELVDIDDARLAMFVGCFANSTTCGYINGSPPPMVNQYGASPSEASVLVPFIERQFVFAFHPDIACQAARIAFGRWRGAILSGSILGQPRRRYI